MPTHYGNKGWHSKDSRVSFRQLGWYIFGGHQRGSQWMLVSDLDKGTGNLGSLGSCPQNTGSSSRPLGTDYIFSNILLWKISDLQKAVFCLFYRRNLIVHATYPPPRFYPCFFYTCFDTSFRSSAHPPSCLIFLLLLHFVPRWWWQAWECFS